MTSRRLAWLGIASVPIYTWALLYGPFRPGRIQPFIVMFAVVFIIYAAACYFVLHQETQQRNTLVIIFGFSVIFNMLLLPSQPTLSDDMYRYVWDGRVQTNGINPYRYASNAPELASLRDPIIWAHMNRPKAITVYPPGAELLFAFLWWLAPDSILIFKIFMIGCELLCGGLLVVLLKRLGERPERVLIFLWSPVLIFEIAHSAHIDAVYLPLIVGALLLRATAPPDRVNPWSEIGIGVLLGASVLIKLYPAMLLVPLWSVRDSHGCRRWRLALPLAALATVAAGYALYIVPGVDTLGFLPSYSREFFNVAPFTMAIMQWVPTFKLPYYLPVNLLMALCVGLVSLYFVVVPARSARQSIMRCTVPIAIYLLISQNLFSWYVLWMLPFIALDLKAGPILGFTLNAAFAWWLFSGLVVLSYTLFITGFAQDWASWLQFIPLYLLLLFPFFQRRFARETV